MERQKLDTQLIVHYKMNTVYRPTWSLSPSSALKTHIGDFIYQEKLGEVYYYLPIAHHQGDRCLTKSVAALGFSNLHLY